MTHKIGGLPNFVIDHITKNGNLIIPDGIYGDSAYLLDEEGFFGPLHIPPYIVPASFSKTTEKEFMIRLNNAGVSLDSEFDVLVKQAEGLDLSYGEIWDLEPEEFVGMLLAGCRSDTPYLIPPDYEYQDFEDFIKGALNTKYFYTKWDKLGQGCVEFWIEMLRKQD